MISEEISLIVLRDAQLSTRICGQWFLVTQATALDNDAVADKTITQASLWHFDWNHPFSGDTIWQENLIVTWFEEETKFWVAVSEALSFSVSGKISCTTNVDWRRDVPSMEKKRRTHLKQLCGISVHKLALRDQLSFFWIALKVCQTLISVA